MYSSLKTSSIVQGFPKYRSNLVGNGAFIPGGFEPIATITTGYDNSITFSNIPQGYASLQLRVLAQNNWTWSIGSFQVLMQFNGDTTSKYASHDMYGDGSAVYADGFPTETAIRAFMSMNRANGSAYYAGGVVDIHDYATTTRYKTVRGFSGTDANGSGQVHLMSGMWASTAAVTSITLFPNGSPDPKWGPNSVIALYGVKAAV